MIEGRLEVVPVGEFVAVDHTGSYPLNTFMVD
jgi:hypothetical protein